MCELKKSSLLMLTLVAGSLVLSPAIVRAQEMGGEEMEVWERGEACWRTSEIDPLMNCFHDDYEGWAAGSTVPLTKAHRRPFFERGFETSENVFVHLIPLSVTVRGDVAIMIYVATSTSRNKETGEETTATQRWTDVMVKDGGTWSYIADHGTSVN